MSKKLLNDEVIRLLAEEAALPSGWWNGPYLTDDGKPKTSIPRCLRTFVDLIVLAADKAKRGRE